MGFTPHRCGAKRPGSDFCLGDLCGKMTTMDAQAAIGFFGTLLAMAVYGALHSLLASRRLKRAVTTWLGAAGERAYRLAYNAIAVITFLPVLAVAILLPGQLLYVISPPWLWVTLALQAIAGLAIFYGLLQTGLGSFLGLSQLVGSTEQADDLVVEGLYQWVRHPLYTAGLVIVWLVPRMTTSILALNLGITAYLYLGSIFEEQKLRAAHGSAYEDYRQQVPRLIPRPWKRFTDEN